MAKLFRLSFSIFAVYVGALAMACTNDYESSDESGTIPIASMVARPSEEPLLALANDYDIFAGYYCEGGDLVVGVTGPIEDPAAQSLRAFVEANGLSFFCHNRAHPSHEPLVVLVQKRYSFLQLRAWRDAVFGSFFNMPGGHRLGINYSANRITMTVLPGLISAGQTVASSHQLPNDSFVVQEDQPAEPKIACMSPSNGQSLNTCFRPIPAGVQIGSAPYGTNNLFGHCTIGSANKLSIPGAGYVPGFVTNSHCVPPIWSQQTDWIYQPRSTQDGSFDQFIGYEFRDPPGWTGGSCPLFRTCRYSDSAWVWHQQGGTDQGTIALTQSWNGYGSATSTACSEGAPPCNLNLVKPRFYLYGSATAIEGMEVEKIGRSTGWTTGQIIDACEDILETDNNVMYLCNGRATNNIWEGDSGSPLFYSWWFRGTDTAQLIGLVWGGDDDGSQLSYSPWANVTYDIGAMDIKYDSVFEYVAGATVTDIGVGADGSVWIATTTPVAGGYTIQRKSGASWTTVAGGAVRLAVDPSGNAWVVDSSNVIRRWTGSTWQQMPGAATDIGIGANGTVWIVGVTNTPGGKLIYRWNGASWSLIPGGATRIAVDPSGNAWITADDNTIWRWVPSANDFHQVAGGARDVGVGSDGMVWVIGTWPTGGGYEIYRWTGIDWALTNGGAVGVSVGPAGKAWLVTSVNEIYKWK